MINKFWNSKGSFHGSEASAVITLIWINTESLPNATVNYHAPMYIEKFIKIVILMRPTLLIVRADPL